MMKHTENAFLGQVSLVIKGQRPAGTLDFALRTEYIGGMPFVTLWFRTKGCSHDHRGGCTMCNYSASSPVSGTNMIEYVRAGLSSLDETAGIVLLVSPSGSMFDEREVPPETRKAILQLVRNTGCSSFLCETRAEIVTEERVKEYAAILGDKIVSIEIGLESSNPWVLKYCINKDLSLNDYKRALQLLRKYQVRSITNVMLGSAFLSPAEAIEDAVETSNWAFEQGTDSAVIFPAHVKKWTVLEWLWRHDLYSPPSLWSLVEVLARLGPLVAQRVTISWYKAYSERTAVGELDPETGLSYLCSPQTCTLCQPRVIALLDAYRNTGDFRLVQELASIECECKDVWRASVEVAAAQPLKQRVAQAYEAIGRNILGQDWWGRYGDQILADVSACLVGSF